MRPTVDLPGEADRAFAEWVDRNPPPGSWAPVRHWYQWGRRAFRDAWIRAWREASP